jgi:hypothetical protein
MVYSSLPASPRIRSWRCHIPRAIAHPSARGRVLIAGALLAITAPAMRSVEAQEAPATPRSVRDLVRGRVATDSGVPIPNARVIAAISWTATFQETTTDSTGHYAFTFTPGAGDYIVTVTAPGRKGFKRRIARVGSDSVFTLDVKLPSATVQQLAGVTVKAPRRSKPPAIPYGAPDVGGIENFPSDYPGAIDFNGDLAVMAATIPGISLVPGADGTPAAVSFLGQSPSQNATTLNGLHGDGIEIPVTALTRTRVLTSAFDPAIGGFSGALTTVSLYQGQSWVQSSAGLRLNAPALQWSDRSGRGLAPEATDVQLSLSRSGPVKRDKLYYSVAGQLQQRTADGSSLPELDGTTLANVGVTPAMRAQFLADVQGLGAPLAMPGRISPVTRRSGSLLGRLDLPVAENDWFDLTASGTWSATDPIALNPASLSTSAGRLASAHGALQAEYGRYIKEYYALRLQSGLLVGQRTAAPVTTMPTGEVMLSSPNDPSVDGPALAATQSLLRFGGAPGLPAASRTWDWQTVFETSWFSPSNAHRPKVALGTSLANEAQHPVGGRLGTFTYQSLDALAANTPSSYTRTLSGGAWEARNASAWLGLGDLWRATSELNIQYGARVEGNRFLTAPAANLAVDSLFGRSTTTVPNTFHVSPRVGFMLRYGHEGRVSPWPRPAAILSGGIGEFRSELPVGTISSALAETGRADALHTLTCVGAATPVPTWSDYASGAEPPTTCLSTPDAAPFASAAPRVTLFDRGYEPARVWRANLAWTHDLVGQLKFTLQGLYTLGRAQPSAVDLNFRGVPQFALAGEGNRPVYARVGEIDGPSGGIAPTAARVSDRFGPVTALVSDLRLESEQLMLMVFPYRGVGVLRTWNVSYAWGQAREQSRGFDDVTVGDPRTITWSPSRGDVRHTISSSLAQQLSDDIRLTVGAQARSGVPFSPRVQGDVNGDGRWNDLAFIPAGGSVIDSLGASVPARVRSCLEAQAGQVATRNSCRGPWTIASWLRVDLSGHPLGGSDRARISLIVANPVAGLDLLLHGTAHAQGWGQPAAPDPTLLRVTGFDSTTQQFRYAVNPRFGDTRLGASPLRFPFQLTVQATIPLASSLQHQRLTAVVAPGRSAPGPRQTPEQIVRTLGRNQYYDVVPLLYAAKDSLLFTAEQVTELTRIGGQYMAARDSIWRAASVELAAMGDTVDLEGSKVIMRRATAAVFERLLVTAADLRGLLADEQIELMAPDIKVLLDDRALRHIRETELRAY